MPWKREGESYTCYMYWNPDTQKGGAIFDRLLPTDPANWCYHPRDSKVQGTRVQRGVWSNDLKELMLRVEQDCEK